MPTYNNDYMHCSQKECKKKDTCYRYWLGQHIYGSGFRYASYFYPTQPVIDGCEHYINLED